MNRKQRCELRKDKNLIKELYSIINKYLPELFDKFDNLTELPYWETIQDVFMKMKISELRDIQKYIVKTLLRSKMFDKYRFNGAFQLLFDGNSFIITGDALYAANPIINIYKKYKWKYIFNFKPDRLKEINDSFEGNIKLVNESGIPNYYLSTNIKYKSNSLNVFKYIDTKNEKTTIISHLNSRNDNSMKCHYFLIQFAHTIRQLLEQGNILTKSLKLKINYTTFVL